MSEQMIWAAGLFEGEGCIRPAGVNSVNLSLNTTDKDVLERFRTAVTAGYVRGPRVRSVGHHGLKPIYSWDLGDANEVERILTEFLPWLGQRRRAKAEQMLERLASNGRHNRFKTVCKHGHPLSGDNLYVRQGGRGCKTCRRRLRMESYHRVRSRRLAGA